MLKPLVRGDVVEIIAPGFGAKPDDLERAKQYLLSLGLTPLIAPDIFGDDLLSAADYDTRLQLIRNAFSRPESQAIWAIKGGYGTSELIPDLLDITAPHPKWLIGFSDITALHNFAHNQLGWPTLHAAVLWQIARNKVDKASIQATEDVIFGRVEKLSYPLVPLNSVAERSTREPFSGEALGSFESSEELSRSELKIKGGNMMLLQGSIGTCWEPELDGAILFFEDIDETAYRVARVLHHFKQAGWFERTHAVVFGDFNYLDRKDDTEKADEVIARFAGELSIPAYRVKGIGHTRINLPLPLNTAATIKDNTLTVQAPA